MATLGLVGLMRTGNTPTQMAMSADQKYLIVGNDNSQIANVFDLDTFLPSNPIIFPADIIRGLSA
jgi:6-phosphogluconolactonase (cycloisomerase 2 family)